MFSLRGLLNLTMTCILCLYVLAVRVSAVSGLTIGVVVGFVVVVVICLVLVVHALGEYHHFWHLINVLLAFDIFYLTVLLLLQYTIRTPTMRYGIFRIT